MSPQTDNGFIKLANELFEAFYRCKLLEYERVVIMCIWRKTYGFNKKEDVISLSQIEKQTGIPKSHVCRTIGQLRDKKIIISKGENIGINKKYYEWVVEWRALPHQVMSVTSSGNKPLPHQVYTKDNIKYTLQKTKEKLVSRLYPQHNPTSWSIINDMYSYEPLDENGNPFKKNKKRITKQENEMLISVGFMWQSMCSEYLGLDEKDIPMKNLYYPIRATYDRTGFQKEDFKKLFKYFFLDNDIKTESKLSFDLCLSEKYVAKYKLNKKLQDKNSSGTFDIKL